MRRLTRRTTLLTLAALPAACAIQPLPPLQTSQLPAPQTPWAPRLPRVGQNWLYRHYNRFNSQVLGTLRETVTALQPLVAIERRDGAGNLLPQEHHATWGRVLKDPAWDATLNLDEAVPLWPAASEPGRSESAHTRYRLDNGSFRYWLNVHCTARGWERVQVSAGAFDCLRVERLLRLDHPDVSRTMTVRKDVMWMAPEVGRWVARETSGEYLTSGDDEGPIWQLEDRWRWELLEWA